MKKHKYELKKDTTDKRDKIYKKRFFLAHLLSKSIDLRPKMPPVLDQGTLGSCTANAISGALGFLELSNGVEVEPVSRLFIYYNERKIEDTVEYDAGAQIRNGVKSLVKYGACAEDLWPYDITEFRNKPTHAAYADALNHKVTLYRRVTSFRDLKIALNEGYPVVLGVEVFAGFESEAATKTGIVPMPKDSEEYLGGHAVLVVGYDDDKKWCIIRNSWGENAGDKGYYYLPYEYIQKYASDLWVIYNKGKVGRLVSTVSRFIKAHVRALVRKK